MYISFSVCWKYSERVKGYLESFRLDVMTQGLVKGALLCFRNPYFYFQHGESTSATSQLTSPASQKSKDLNKGSLLLQDLGTEYI